MVALVACLCVNIFHLEEFRGNETVTETVEDLRVIGVVSPRFLALILKLCQYSQPREDCRILGGSPSRTHSGTCNLVNSSLNVYSSLCGVVGSDAGMLFSIAPTTTTTTTKEWPRCHGGYSLVDA